MAKKEFKLTEIKKGYNIAWTVCSQCLFTGTITLTDNAGKVYFQYPKTNRKDIMILPVMYCTCMWIFLKAQR